MTRKVYKSAMGKTVDLGALLLQNEQVRAVGNMGVNAAGDLINSNNRVIDQKNRQVQRQYQKQTNVTAGPVPTSNLTARQMNQTQTEAPVAKKSVEPEIEEDIFEPPPVEVKPQTSTTEIKSGGLAAAIARNREIKQELEKTRRQLQQEQGLKKI